MIDGLRSAFFAVGLGIVVGCASSRDIGEDFGHLASVSESMEVQAPSAQPQQAPTDDYVPVPGRGRMHRSCVHAVPNGALIMPNGDIVVDGVTVAHHAACAPGQAPSGLSALGPGGGTASPNTNEDHWVEEIYSYVDYANYYSFTSMTTTWNVPEVPATNDNQVLFYWPGIDNLSYLLQPVLQWGRSAAGGGAYWSITSWYCYPGPPANCFGVSQPVAVPAGATIRGSVFRQTCYPNYGCYWKISIEQVGAPNSLKYVTALLPENQAFDRALAGVLEGWWISRCSDYPPAQYTCLGGSCWRTGPSAVTFNVTEIDALNPSGQTIQVFPQWGAEAGGTPSCNFVPVATSTGGKIQVN